MRFRPCPWCKKEIPHSIEVCPYCRRDEAGKELKPTGEVTPAPAEDQAIQNEILNLASEDRFIRDRAIEDLSKRGPVIIPLLTKMLREHQKKGLAGAAKTLGRLRDPQVIPVLLQAMKMGDEDLRVAAIWSLGQYRDQPLAQELSLEAEHQNPTMQGYIAYLLGYIREADTVPALIKLAQSRNSEAAFHASMAIGETGDSSAIAALQKVLSRKDPLLRASAARSIRRLGGSIRPTLGWKWIAGAGVTIAAAGSAWFWLR